MILIFTLCGFILGAVLGSFAKALADRSLKNKTFLGRSICPSCKHKLVWYDLFPIISYLILRGQCRYCHKKIGLEYPVVEFLTGILVALIFWQASSIFPTTNSLFSQVNFAVGILWKIIFIVTLVVITITDIKETFIPDRIIFPAIKLLFIVLLLFNIYQVVNLYLLLDQSLLGKYLLPPHSDYLFRHAFYIVEPFLLSILTGVLIAGFFLFLIIITKGKGMGGGDVKVGALMGLALGFPQGFLALMLAFISGAVYSLGLIALKRKKIGENIPFGPFLVLGSLTSLYFGSYILNWYLSFSRV